MTDMSPISAANASGITAAIKRAGAATGAGVDFLMKMAARESNFDPAAKAKTSSASGLFQFIDQTWLGAVKSYGAKHGLGAYAADISQDAAGRFTVADSGRRADILNLRFNPGASSAMAGELANENKTYLEKRLGRAVGATELYAAHFLGPAGAAKLLGAGAGANAAELLPKAAAANHNVFFDGSRARSVGEVVNSIAHSMGIKGKENAFENVAPMTGDPIQPGAAANNNAPSSKAARSAVTDHARAPRIEFPLITRLAPQSLNALTLSVMELFDPTRIGEDSDKRKRF